MAMLAQIICEPLLGQTTVVLDQTITITVVLVPSQSTLQWEVAVWHDSSASRDWTHTGLDLINQKVCSLNENECEDSATRLYNGTLQRPSDKGNLVHFTIKYRIAGQNWHWVNGIANTGDAEIIFAEEANWSRSTSLSHYLQTSDGFISVARQNDDIPSRPLSEEISVWYMTSPIPGAKE